MRHVAFHIAIASVFLAAPAVAQDAAAPAAAAPLVIKAGKMVRSSDGAPIGYIDEVQKSGGEPVSVSIIYDQRFVHIPASTLSAGPKSLVTSLTAKDVAKLN
jgi:hypothetical protein